MKSSSYRDGKLKKCTICVAYIKNSFTKCPCCHNRLSTKTKSRKDKRSKKGDIAFHFFTIDASRSNHELQYLPKFYKYPELGARILERAWEYLDKTLLQYEIMQTVERQRPEYLHAKYIILQKLKDKIKLKKKEYWKNVARFQ